MEIKNTTFTAFKPFSEFRFWFEYVGKQVAVVYHRFGDTFANLGVLNTSTYTWEQQFGDSIYSLDSIKQSYEDWLNRPEGYLMTIAEGTPDIVRYNSLLASSIFGRVKFTKSDPDAVLSSVENCLSWLGSTDFYTAPASTRYHDSCTGGLLRHSLEVIDKILELRRISNFSRNNAYSSIFVAAVHDWCKIGYYETYNKNVKGADGNWYQQVAYRRTEDPVIYLGHGVSSMYIAQMFVTLTMEEAAAIRYHMGAWHSCSSELDELQHANEMLPLVLALQFADQMAVVKYD